MDTSDKKLEQADKPLASGQFLDTGLDEKITGITTNPVAGAEQAEADQPATFPIGKLDAHLENIPHMAISIFVFYRHKLLLQKRAATKYHSGGLWVDCTKNLALVFR